MNCEYVAGNKIKKKYKVSTASLRLWAEAKKIRCVKTPGGKRLFCSEDIKKIFEGDNDEWRNRKKICYCRVSSDKQKEDLKRQKEYFEKEYPNYEIIQDIGSGLNWKRKGFNDILDQICEGNVEELVVMYKDRLCRFGFDLIKKICKKFDTKLVVQNKLEEKLKAPEKELSDDLLSIVTVFVAKKNGLRRGKNKKRRKRREDSGSTSNEDTSNDKTEEEIE